MPDNAQTISCGRHGERVSAVVCGHHLASPESVGFVENNDDPSNLQAWCDECERIYLEQGGMTEEFRRFNNFAIVCDLCYIAIKSRHSVRP